MRHIFIICFLFSLAACGSKADKTPATKPDQTVNNVPANNDTLFIDSKSAIYYFPDSVRMAKWKKEVGEEDFETVADDWSYYMMTSKEFLAKTPVPVIDASDKKIVKFIKADKSFTLVGLDTLTNYWGLFIFRPDAEPEFGDIVMMNETYKNYFEKKK